MAALNFFNENEYRAFPFLVGTVGEPPSGPLTLQNLPNNIIVDAGFCLTPLARFSSQEHTVRLNKIVRSSGVFYFEFVSDAPELSGVILRFSRAVGDAEYKTSFADTGESGLSSSSLSASSSSSPNFVVGLCGEPLWSGYLVTGDLSVLDSWLAVDGEVLGGAGKAEVEPSLLENLANGYVERITVANVSRTHYQVADDSGCEPVSYPDLDEVYIAGACLAGPVVFKPGYNLTARQISTTSTIILGAAVGAGEGQPCEEIPLFPGESPPDGSSLLSGGPGCGDVIRTINGSSAANFMLFGGGGISVTPVPDEHEIQIGANLIDLHTCG